MSLTAFRKALDAVAEPVFVTGTHRTSESVAIALPDGDVAAVDDKTFVAWLVEHGEPAPFGAGTETKQDKKVRDAVRLVARGACSVANFEPSEILDEIERALSPGEHLEARLTDVLAYPKGGHFARHKDTPRDADLIGTLVVCLPVAHEGGQFTISDREDHVIDWAGKPDRRAVSWVAMFSDVDHAISPVTKGTRVTLVYSLSRSGRPREDKAHAKHMAKVGKLAASQAKGSLVIACARPIITDGRSEVHELDVLRGSDRAIADALVDAGLRVTVRSCITAVDMGEGEDRYKDEGTTARLRSGQLWSVARLAKPITPRALRRIGGYVTFARSATADEGRIRSTSFASFIKDRIWFEDLVIRNAAAATLLLNAYDFSESGYFGNEGHSAHIYSLAVMEASKRKRAAKKASKPGKPTKRARR